MNELAELSSRVRGLWARVLGVPVTDETDFFEVGGHSFHALEIFAELDTEFGTRLPLSSLFDNPRFGAFVAAVAEEVAEQTGKQTGAVR
jgi:acyl carrier protein